MPSIDISINLIRHLVKINKNQLLTLMRKDSRSRELLSGSAFTESQKALNSLNRKFMLDPSEGHHKGQG